MTPNPPSRPGIVAILCLVAFSFLLAALSVWQPQMLSDFLAGRNDFALLYTAGRLARSPDLYSFPVNEKLQIEAVGARPIPPMIYLRPPFYAVLLMPLAALPYRTAYGIFQLLNLLCLGAAGWLLARRSIEILVLAAISVPLLLAFMYGQDVFIYVFGYAAFYCLLEKRRGFLAGLALSICLIKFHLFPLTAIALLLRKEWGAFKGAVVALAALCAASFAVQGPRWPQMYLATLQNPDVNPSAEIMPNLHGLAALMGWGNTMIAVLVALVLVAFVVIAARSCERSLLYALALVGGLLLSFHAYPQDAALLLVALGILDRAMPTSWFQQLLRFAATPVPYAFLSIRNRLSTMLVLVMLAAFASGIWQAARRNRAPASVPSQL